MTKKDWYAKIQEEYHGARNTKAFYSTTGFKKLWNAFNDVLKKESLISEIKKIRKNHAIPDTGFALPKGTSSYPPKEWKYSKNLTTKSKQMMKIHTEMEVLAARYHFLPQDWASSFEQYLFYNKPLITPTPASHNLCFVSDMNEKKDSLGRDITSAELRAYPITIHISPLASGRDIKNYIEKLYSTEIAPVQKKYKTDNEIIGKSRKKKPATKKINDFLYNNQDWSLKDLQKAVSKEFLKDLDVGAIGAIISKQNKKRT